MRVLFPISLFCFIFTFTACQTSEKKIQIIDLSGSWQFQKQGDSLWFPAQVPGTVQTDLFANNQIPDPYYSDNEAENKWIENENWVYRKHFNWSKSNNQHADLVFEGLDTYATVYLNDHRLFSSDNMFRSYKLNIDSLLQEGKNELIILFESPIKKAESSYDSLTYRLPADNDRNEKQTSVFTRKAPYHYGWDWGPRYVTMGIWRPASIQLWDNYKVQDNRIHQFDISDEKAVIIWESQVYSDQEAVVNRKLIHENEAIVSKSGKLIKGVNFFCDTFQINNPQRWWPNGYGEAKLYHFQTNFSQGEEKYEEEFKIGLREVELINEEDSIGESFYFKINGKAIYAKGANYIPQDNFLPNVDPFRYNKLIKSVSDANMNMLRVWGGGIYEDDLFYDLCDEKGILVWQDFMFACSLYPGDALFLANVEQEARDNIIRLRDHPSVVLWCGNNEINELWYNWGYQEKFGYSKTDSLKIWNDYQGLFNGLLPSLVKALDPGIPYWESSPKIGWGHLESLNRGDSHYWGVWWGNEPFEVYRKKVARFSSEFGFQSMPQMSTILAFADSSEMEIDSKAMLAHQKSSIGNKTLIEYMNRDFTVPSKFEDFVYVSQLVQAYGLSIALEAQRRAKPRSMGSLYWQLNDCWPGISWSSLDYFGNWKALHYEAQSDFKNFLISFEERNDGVAVFVVSDSLVDIQTRLELKLMDFYGKVLIQSDTFLVIPANISKEVLKINSDKISQGVNREEMVLSAKLFVGSRSIAENNFFFSRPKDLILPSETQVSYKVDGQEIRLWSTMGTLIKNIYLETENNVHFSKNYFDILPNDTVSLQFESKDDLIKGLRFKSLEDIKSAP